MAIYPLNDKQHSNNNNNNNNNNDDDDDNDYYYKQDERDLSRAKKCLSKMEVILFTSNCVLTRLRCLI